MERKRKGFTLVELLVVIAIIALLMGILMPALARVRQIAFRLVCGTNLKGIGTAMLIYANDYEDELPRAGGPTTTQGPLANWLAGDRRTAFGLANDGSGGKATLSSHFFLLVKYAEVTPKSFICKGDSGVHEFKLSDHNVNNKELIEVWDFGESKNGTNREHCSYSYHYPFGQFALTTSTEPGMAVAADRNPWTEDNTGPPGETQIWSGNDGFDPADNASTVKQKEGNAITHQDDGQNVLFMDGHVNFEKRSYCGIDDDNIYTYYNTGTTNPLTKRKANKPAPGGQPGDRQDSYLIIDGPGGGITRCFPADTPVWVNGKLVPILEVVSGQTVGKIDADGNLVPTLEVIPGQTVDKLDSVAVVERIQEHGEGVYDCYDMVLESGNSITVVHTHYFLTISGKWVAVENLTSGSKLQSLKGPISITSVVKRAMPFVGNAYNLKIKGANRYFVGKDGVVAVDCSKLPGE